MAIWCSFFIIVAFIYLITFALPNTFVDVIDTNLYEDCPDFVKEPQIQKDNDLQSICSQFTPSLMQYGGVVYGMSRMNQFLIINLQFTKNNNDVDKEVVLNTQFMGHFYELTSDFQIDNRIDTENPHKITITCPKGTIYCNPFQLLYYNKIDHPNYAFVVNFSALIPWTLRYSINFEQEYVNSSYTGFLIALRYTCLVVSIVMCVSYVRKLQRINSSHWVIEQRMIVLLSGLLILFNNPFYALTILVPNMASAFFDVLFIVNFFVILLLFFLVVLDRVVNENGQKNSIALNKKKIIFTIILFFFLLLTYIGFSYNHLNDPYTSFEDSFGGFYDFCKWVGIILLIGYFIAILVAYIYIFKKYNSLIWRNRLFSLFSLYYIICTGLFAFSGSLDIYGTIGGRALLFITILNLYIYYMQYMYSFSPQGFQEAQQMINLEIGNRPQIYEVLDDSLHGIDLASQNGDGAYQKHANNNEQILAQDIFQQHQIYNQLQDQHKDGHSQPKNQKFTTPTRMDNNNQNNYTPQNPQHHEEEGYNQQQQVNDHNEKYYSNENNNHNNNNNYQQHHNNQNDNDNENGDVDLVLNFDKDDDEDD